MKGLNFCPVCGRKERIQLLHRHDFPLTSSKYTTDEDGAIAYPRGEVDMVVCENCGLVYNRKYDSGLSIYDEGNYNERDNSEFYSDYIHSEVDYISSLVDSGYRVIEIGCGKTYSFLRLLKKNKPEPSYFGYDPTVDVSENHYGIELKNEYFKPIKGMGVDAFLSRHVIEHISDPSWMLDVDTIVNPRNLGAFGFIETPDVIWNLRKTAWFNWSYEHCSNFSTSTFCKAAEIYDWKGYDIKKEYGNEYLWVTIFNDGRKKNNSFDYRYELEEELNLAEKYSLNEKRLFEQIDNITNKGEWALWGVSGKGSTVLNLMDPCRKKFSFVIDIDKRKQGKYVCGTGHKICLPSSLVGEGGSCKVESILIMNKLYKEEIQKELISLGARKEVNIVAIDEIL